MLKNKVVRVISGVLVGGLCEKIEQIPFLTWCKWALGKGVKNEELAVGVASQIIGRVLTVKDNIDEACAICMALAIIKRTP